MFLLNSEAFVDKTDIFFIETVYVSQASSIVILFEKIFDVWNKFFDCKN